MGLTGMAAPIARIASGTMSEKVGAHSPSVGRSFCLIYPFLFDQMGRPDVLCSLDCWHSQVPVKITRANWQQFNNETLPSSRHLLLAERAEVPSPPAYV